MFLTFLQWSIQDSERNAPTMNAFQQKTIESVATLNIEICKRMLLLFCCTEL